MKLNEERLMQMYFEAQVAFAGQVSPADEARVFGALSNAYGVAPDEGARLFALAQAPALCGIDSNSRFKQQKRIQQFAKEYGACEVLSEEQSELLDIKGKALKALTDANIISDGEPLKSDSASRIMQSARAGSVCGMLVSAIMLLEGCLVDKNASLGKRALGKLSLWTSEDAQLLGLYYDPENASRYLARLSSLTKGLPSAELYEAAAKGATEEREDKGMTILRKTVEKGFAKEDRYQSSYARVAHSEVLSALDKSRVLLSGDERYVKSVGALPLKLTKKQVKLSVSDVKTRFERVEEQKMVGRVLSSGLVFGGVCFMSDSQMLLKEYISSIEASADAKVQSYNLDRIDEQELVGDVSNIFLRGISENEKNCILLFVPRNCPAIKVQAALDFLDGLKRAHFKVKSLNVELDLSSLAVVLFADPNIKNMLGGRAAAVSLSLVGAEEKKRLLNEYALEFAKRYDISGGLKLEQGARNMLLSLDMEEAVGALEQAARRAIIDGTQEISEECISKCRDEACGYGSSFGFGRKN